jgi:hypothetical protein
MRRCFWSVLATTLPLLESGCEYEWDDGLRWTGLFPLYRGIAMFILIFYCNVVVLLARFVTGDVDIMHLSNKVSLQIRTQVLKRNFRAVDQTAVNDNLKLTTLKLNNRCWGAHQGELILGEGQEKRREP